MRQKYTVLSIHDVAPKFSGEIKEIVAELDRKGYDRRSIGLVPNYEMEHELTENRDFTEWLRGLQHNGNEMVLHGYSHFSDKRTYPNMVEFVKGELFALGEAEFQNLSYNEAAERLRKGKDMFDKLGLKSRGFIPPCWITNPESQRAIQDAGFEYMVSSGRVIDFVSGEHTKSKTFFFSSKSPFMDFATRAYDYYIEYIHLVNKDLATVPIHPRNIREKRSFQHFLDVLKRLKEDGRELVTYSEFLELKHRKKEN
jgi:predicted deacetylase